MQIEQTEYNVVVSSLPPSGRGVHLIELRDDCRVILNEVEEYQKLFGVTESDMSAIAYATVALNGKYRKCSGNPFVVHAIDTQHRIAEVTDDPVTRQAAGLHDVIEESPLDEFGNKIYNPKTLGDVFGSEVAGLVEILTPPEAAAREYEAHRDNPIERIIYWRNKKAAALRQVTRSQDPRAILIKSADILSNVSDFIDDKKRINPKTNVSYGNLVFDSFKMPRELILERFKVASIALNHAFSRITEDTNPFALQMLEKTRHLISDSLNSDYEALYSEWLDDLQRELIHLK